MDGTTFAAYIRKRTKTDSTSFTDDDIVLYGNVDKDVVAREVESVKKDFFVIPATTDLIADQREYSFPVDLLSSIKIVEAKLDGTNWKRVEEFDLNSFREVQTDISKPYNVINVEEGFSNATTDEDNIRDNFSDDTPLYEITRSSIKLYTASAITSVTSGLKIHYAVYPADITTSTLSETDDLSIDPTTTSFGIPRQFHKYWAMKIIIAYKEDNDIPLDSFDMAIGDELIRAKKSISQQNQDRSFQPSVPRRTGFGY